MRGVALWILASIASCAPDYGHTAFRCDAEHGCPDGQSCVGGRCRRGTPVAPDGVVCGAVVCDATQQCCDDDDGTSRCIAAGDVCPGDGALCDGVEDCQARDLCCADGDLAFCDASCRHAACREDTDCPSLEPHCCPGDSPWKVCSSDRCVQ